MDPHNPLRRFNEAVMSHKMKVRSALKNNGNMPALCNARPRRCSPRRVAGTQQQKLNELGYLWVWGLGGAGVRTRRAYLRCLIRPN